MLQTGLHDYLKSLIQGRDLHYPSPFLVSIVGGGGKTTTLTDLFQHSFRKRSILTTTTAMGIPGAGGRLSPPLTAEQDKNPALKRIFLEAPQESGVWFGSLIEGTKDKYKGVDPDRLDAWIREQRSAGRNDSILFCEADGSKRKPLKAHAGHEPVIPRTSDLTLIIFGLSGLGRPLDEDGVHRSPIFSELTGKGMGETVTMEDLLTLLDGGHFLKGVPPTSRVAVIFNQTDLLPPEERTKDRLQMLAGKVLENERLDAVFFMGQKDESRETLFGGQRAIPKEPVFSAVILAAGMSTRMEGKNKLLLPLNGQPVISHTIRNILKSDISELIIVTGYQGREVKVAVQYAIEKHERAGLPISFMENFRFQEGQASSVAKGAESLDPGSLAAFFIPGDQPFIPPTLIRQLLEEWKPGHILVPVHEGERSSPVLIDRLFYNEMKGLKGDSGGRQVMRKHPEALIEVEVSEPLSAWDLDTPEDYAKAQKALSQGSTP